MDNFLVGQGAQTPAAAAGAVGGNTVQLEEQLNLWNGKITEGQTGLFDVQTRQNSDLIPRQVKITTLQTQQANLTEALNMAQINLNQVNEWLSNKNSIIGELQQQIESAPENQKPALQAQLAQYEAEKSNLEKQQAEAQKIVNEYATELTNTTAELQKEAEEYKQKEAEFNAQAQQLQNQINEATTNLDNVKAQLDTAKAQEQQQAQAAAPAAQQTNEMQKRVENGAEFDVQTQVGADGNKTEVFFQNGVKIKSRDIDAQGRITRGTHYDADGKETGHYERAFNEDGSFYDKWYDGDKTYTSKVTHRDAVGNMLNEIEYNSATGEVMQPPTRTRVENGIEYTIETKANQDGTYTETFYQDGVKIKYRNLDGRGRITEGVHFDENGNVTGRYGRAYHADGSFTDAWFDGNNTEPSVVTQRDAFGNDKNAIQPEAVPQAQIPTTETEEEVIDPVVAAGNQHEEHENIDNYSHLYSIMIDSPGYSGNGYEISKEMPAYDKKTDTYTTYGYQSGFDNEGKEIYRDVVVVFSGKGYTNVEFKPTSEWAHELG